MWTHARVRSFGSGRRRLRARSRRAQTQRCRSRKRQSSASRSSAGVRAPDARKGPRLIGKREIDHHDPRRGRRFSAAYFDAAHGLVNLLGRGYQGQGNAAPAAQFGHADRTSGACQEGIPLDPSREVLRLVSLTGGAHLMREARLAGPLLPSRIRARASSAASPRDASMVGAGVAGEIAGAGGDTPPTYLSAPTGLTVPFIATIEVTLAGSIGCVTPSDFK
jgi:hypothetical protein